MVDSASEEERLWRFLQLGDKLEELYLINSYYLFRNLQKIEWKIDWKTLVLLFVTVEQPVSIADIIKEWPFFRHYKDISPRLPPLVQLGLVDEATGPKNAKLLHATTKGRFVAAFLFYLVAFDNKDFTPFTFIKNKFPELPGFENDEVLFSSLKVLKSQMPALREYIPKVQGIFEDLNWRLDYKTLLVPLYLLEADAQSYTDLLQNYPQFGYYRELKQRVAPLVSLGVVNEEKAGRKGIALSLTRKGKLLLCFFGYLLNFPQLPSA